MHRVDTIIFFISNYEGGVYRYTVNHATHLCHLGYNVKIFCYAKDNLVNLDFHEKIVVLKIELRKNYLLQLFKNLQFNLVKTSFVCAEASELELLYELKLDSQISFVLHGDYAYYTNTALKYIGFIDSVVCVSKTILNKLNKNPLIFNKRRLKYVPHKLDPFKTSKSIKKRNKSISFVGRPTHEKGFHIIIDLINKLDALQIFYSWHFYGFDKPDFVVLEDFSSKLIFHGYLQHEELLEKLSESQFLILPSVFEGLPISILEAFTLSVIPICSRFNDEVDSLINNGKNGFISISNDVNDYIKILQFLYNNEINVVNNDEILIEFYEATIEPAVQQSFVTYYNKNFRSRLNRIYNLLTNE